MKTNDLNNSPFDKTAFGSLDRTDAAAPYDLTNEGGITTAETSAASHETDLPRLVTRGESFDEDTDQNDGESHELCIRDNKAVLITTALPVININPEAAIVDFLNCSFNFENIEIQEFFSGLLPILGHSFTPAIDRGMGFRGYKYSFKLGNSAALFAYGGNRGTGFLSFSGVSCHRIPDWPRLVDFLELRMKARITRWDGAYDDFSGTHSVDNALRMYQEGLFNSGGRKPLMDLRGNWIEPDGRGRTLYIGTSKNGKMARIYEKGMQLKIPFHPWVRWEVQLGNRDRVIPWEAVLHPGNYLAGTYINALSWISEEQSRIKTLQNTAKLGYESLNHWHKNSWGKHINVMMIKEGEDAERVIEILRRDGFPARLDLPDLPNYGKVLP